MNNKVKWRGIATTQVKKYEDKPVTITNRFKQKSFSLPRIDDKKRWAGYPGNTGISRVIIPFIPKCLYYVEPFAGAVKVGQELLKKDSKKHWFVFNDKSPFIYKWLKKEFFKPKENSISITNTDFTNCLKIWDDKKTFFLIDPPWFKTYYDQDFSWFDRPSVKNYDIEVINMCKTLEGKFIITTRKENKIMLKSGFNNYLIQSEYVVCGKKPQVLLTTNIKLKGLENAR